MIFTVSFENMEKSKNHVNLLFTVSFYPFTCYLHVIYIVCKFSTFPVIIIIVIIIIDIVVKKAVIVHRGKYS